MTAIFHLDHSQRLVGSGNDNEVSIQSKAKFMFVSNPVANRPTIHSHVGLIDLTFMSRLLWWVQDKEEVDYALSEKGIIRNSPHTYTSISYKENRKKDILLSVCWGDISSRDEFLTLFDTCYSFITTIEDKEVFRISNLITQLAKEPMKSVWRPRSEHHVRLLIDGLVKHRCLFIDYDDTFTPKQEDFDLAERILIRMVKSWDLNILDGGSFT